MKKVMGGNVPEEESGRCKDVDVMCFFDGTGGYTDGTCKSVGSKGQCRCVRHNAANEAVESVPHGACLA